MAGAEPNAVECAARFGVRRSVPLWILECSRVLSLGLGLGSE
jgi:hypothetical protein